jgi:hypothetical protein
VIGNVVVVVPVIVPAQLSVAVGAVGAATLHSAVRSESVVTFATGAVVSTTVIVCVYVVALLLSSVAVQTLVITELFPVPETVVSADVIVTLVSQLSVAVAVPVSDVSVLALHSTVTLAGELVNVGAVVSTTVIVCVYVVALLFSSVAVQTLVITELFPVPATVVSADVIVTLVSQLSVAVAIPVSDVSVLALHSTVKLAGELVNVGAVVSTTVMV